MGPRHYEGDSDLEATLGVIDCTFGYFKPMCWQTLSFTIPHHGWMGHVLYCPWDVLQKGEPLPHDIKEFGLHSPQLETPPPALIVVDCLLIIGLVLDVKLHVHLLAADKRWIYLCIHYKAKLICLAVAMKSTPTSTESTRSSQRCSGTLPHHQ